MITKLIPYINMEGNAEEAMDFYCKIFECAKRDIMRYSEVEDYLASAEWGLKVMHGYLEFKNFELYFSDMPEGEEVTPGRRVSLTLVFDSEEEVGRVYEALKEDGEVHMELQKTFWNAVYASVTDRFGIGWELNYPMETTEPIETKESTEPIETTEQTMNRY